MYYFSYGSNLHPVRLTKRISSAKLVSAVCVNNYKLKFHKKSKDGSAKCNLIETSDEKDQIFGAIYEIDTAQKAILDGFEGLGSGYFEHRVQIVKENNTFDCFTYIAQQSFIVDNMLPYNWYKEMVVIGAEYLQVADEYIAEIESNPSIDDQNIKRKLEQECIIREMINYR